MSLLLQRKDEKATSATSHAGIVNAIVEVDSIHAAFPQMTLKSQTLSPQTSWEFPIVTLE
jgi:hypothetical protein